MQNKIMTYQVDAFADKLFSGNPAAVCLLDEWLSSELMQKIGAENNLSETAFVVPKGDNYKIRWFTPTIEVELCGHATLASAHVLFTHNNYLKEKIIFHSRKRGELTVKKDGDFLTLDFPADKVAKIDAPHSLLKAFNLKPLECYKGRTDYMLIYSSQEEIEKIQPDFNQILLSGARGVIVTAKGKDTDFVSRFFAPNAGINEDPVTGSAHTSLTPYWTEKTGKNVLTAKQISKRQGELKCELSGGRVKISGKAITYLIGEIEI
jgi:PhzF family phenazine biosynthesis protein